jgi:hypothetical protein
MILDKKKTNDEILTGKKRDENKANCRHTAQTVRQEKKREKSAGEKTPDDWFS